MIFLHYLSTSSLPRALLPCMIQYSFPPHGLGCLVRPLYSLILIVTPTISFTIMCYMILMVIYSLTTLLLMYLLTLVFTYDLALVAII